MEQIEILAVGTHADIMKTILRLINNKPGWHGTIASSAAEAIAGSHTTAYKVILVCAGLSADETQQLHAHFKVPIVQHYGGGSGLLYAEICGVLKIALP